MLINIFLGLSYMTQESRKRGKLTLAVMGLLVIGELVISLKASHGQNFLKEAFWYFSIVGIPLCLVFSSIYLGKNLRFPIFLGWVCIFCGFYMQYGYYTSHDPSKVMLLGISIITYWICGVLALFSTSFQEPG